MRLWPRFRVALAEDGTTLRAWAARAGRTPSHVRQVADGSRRSEALAEEIAEYIEDVEARIRRRLGAA